jgi:hypothetical protein
MITAPTAVVYDLDSTIAHTVHRHDLFPTEWSRTARDAWVKYCMACPGDTPIEGTVQRMRMDWQHHQVHICTGRMIEAEALTKEWLEKYTIPYDALKMREVTDTEAVLNSDLKINYILWLRDQGVDVKLTYEDNPVISAHVAKKTGVPVLGINPFYPAGKEDRFYHTNPVNG